MWAHTYFSSSVDRSGAYINKQNSLASATRALGGILSDGIPSVTGFSSSNMNSANIGATGRRPTI